MADPVSFDGAQPSPHTTHPHTAQQSPQTSPPLSPIAQTRSFSLNDLRAYGRGRPITLEALQNLSKSYSNGALEVTDNHQGPFVPNIPLSPTTEAKASNYRLIIVANRLNVTAKRDKDGKYRFDVSSGGLASGLAGVVKKTKCLYYGWLGLEVPEAERQEMTKRALEEHGATPVYIPDERMELYYNGFSNSILWPLLHYHPEGISFDEDTWKAYQDVNQQFAQTIAQDVQDGDVVWIHDYHLMLLPSMLRVELAKRNNKPKNVKIGFFLHTPFPSSEIYRILPAREEILEGMLDSDLIGFQTIDYARHFLNACSKVLHLATTPAGVYYKGNFVAVQDFPIGIDVEKFTEGLKKESVIERINQLKKRFDGVKIIVGVDRLDYIKGVQQKMHALEVFLTEHPEFIGKVVLIQVAVPTRGDVEEYQNLRATVNELVGRINGKHGTFEFTPIHFLHQSVDLNELTALYAISDVCLVTSTRDGMNLVSYEYIACQEARHGVMILSEFAGAAQSLNGSIIVNPWNTDMVAAAIFEAVTMTDEQKKENYLKLQRRVSRYTSRWWGDSFVSEIIRISDSTAKLESSDPVAGTRKYASGWSTAATAGSDIAVEVMTPSNFSDVTSGITIAQLPELERCPKKGEAVYGQFREDEEDDNEKYEFPPLTALPTPPADTERLNRYMEAHGEDEGIMLMAPRK